MVAEDEWDLTEGEKQDRDLDRILNMLLYLMVPVMLTVSGFLLWVALNTQEEIRQNHQERALQAQERENRIIDLLTEFSEALEQEIQVPTGERAMTHERARQIDIKVDLILDRLGIEYEE